MTHKHKQYPLQHLADDCVSLHNKRCNKCSLVESLKASHYAESVDAGMRERRLKRALWLARLGIAKMRISWYKLWNGLISTINPEDGARQDFDRWKNFEQECRAMVDKFK